MVSQGVLSSLGAGTRETIALLVPLSCILSAYLLRCLNLNHLRLIETDLAKSVSWKFLITSDPD